jgi:hypothetical protein
VRLSASPSRTSFSACAGAATTDSFPASRDRVKGAARRLAAWTDGVQPGLQPAVELPALPARLVELDAGRKGALVY